MSERESLKVVGRRRIRWGLARIQAVLDRAQRQFGSEGHVGPDRHLGWCNYQNVIYRTLEYQHWENKADVIPIGNYYEFGLAVGFTFKRAYRAISEIARDLGMADTTAFGVKMFGFDSFEGLPEPGEWDRREGWEQGTFANTKENFVAAMDAELIPRQAYELVEGYYEKSLTNELRRRLDGSKPSIVMMDCDFYSSTKTVLEWLRPLLRDGTMFMFDDIWAYMGHPDFGELRAIREFNEQKDGLLVPHVFGGSTQQVYVYTTGYQGAAYKQYLAAAKK